MIATAALAARIADARLDWIVPRWDEPPNVQALFTTRNGSGGAPFDVGPARLEGLDARARERVLADRARVRAFLPATPAYLEQVHGAAVARIDEAPTGERGWPVADAAVTRARNVVLAVRVADCLPVLLADAAGTVVGAAHAGWRGLAAGVLEATMGAMDVPAASLRAWIGPGIGPGVYEVSADVLAAFADRDPGAATHFIRRAEGRWLADLPAIAERRLRAAGVAHVAQSGLCTLSDASRFHSFRRDRSSGRMAAYVWRTGAEPRGGGAMRPL